MISEGVEWRNTCYDAETMGHFSSVQEECGRKSRAYYVSHEHGVCEVGSFERFHFNRIKAFCMVFDFVHIFYVLLDSLPIPYTINTHQTVVASSSSLTTLFLCL